MSREAWIGIGGAALFIVLLWLGLPHLPSGSAGGVKAGFVGQTQLGPWTLNCLAPQLVEQNGQKLPAFTLWPGHRSTLPPPPGSDVRENSLGRCRATQAYYAKNDSTRPFAILALRTIGPEKLLVVVLRVPAVAKTGDRLVLELGQQGIALPVQRCEPGFCLAAQELKSRGESLLLSHSQAVLVFPPGADGKRQAARISLEGADRAVAGMRQAE